jgi:hypothetical protein
MFRISGLSRKEVQYNGRRAVEEVADKEKISLCFHLKQTDAQKETDQTFANM